MLTLVGESNAGEASVEVRRGGTKVSFKEQCRCDYVVTPIKDPVWSCCDQGGNAGGCETREHQLEMKKPRSF